MSEKTGRNAFYVTIFAVCSLGILILGGGYLCGYDMLNTTNCYKIVLYDCQNLTVGNAVCFKGYKVGTIRSITFDKKELKFEIDFCIDKGIKVTKDSSISVCSSLLGNKSLELSLGAGEIVSPGAILPVAKKTGDLEANIAAVVAATKDILTTLNTTLSEVNKNNVVGGVQSLLDTLQKTIVNLDTVITDFKAHPRKYIKIF